MARASLVEELEDFLSCDICYNRFEGRDPRSLSCHHSFCFECLRDIDKTALQEDTSRRGRITCPKCQQSTVLPVGSLEALPPYFQAHQVHDILRRARQNEYVPRSTEYLTCMVCKASDSGAYCFNCAKSMCLKCHRNHDKNKRFLEHVSIVADRNLLESLECPQHPDLIEAFCLDCSIRVCRHCMLTNHSQHDFTDFSFGTRLFKASKAKILASKGKIFTNADQAGSLMTMLNAKVQELAEQIRNLQGHDKNATPLHMQLQELKKNGMQHIQNILDKDQEIFTSLQQKEVIINKLSQPVLSVPQLSLKNIKDETEEDIPVVNQMELTLGQVIFVPDKKNRGKTGTLNGSFIAKHSSMSNQEMLPETSISRSREGASSCSTDSQTMDVSVSEPIPPVSTQLMWSVGTGAAVRSLDFLPNGDIIIVVQGVYTGPEQVKVFDIHGQAKPLPFDISGVRKPFRIAVHKRSSTVAVTDIHHSTITILAKTSEWYTTGTFDIDGTPWCLTFTPAGGILVGTAHDRTLLRYTTTGKKLWCQNLQYDCFYVKVDRNNRIIISDLTSIYIHNEDMQKLLTVTDPNQILRGICLDNLNNILVADMGRKAVVQLNPNGEFMREVVKLRDSESYVLVVLLDDKNLVLTSWSHGDVHTYQVDFKYK